MTFLFKEHDNINSDRSITIDIILDLKESVFVPNKNYKIYLHSLIYMCLGNVIKEIPDKAIIRVWTKSVVKHRIYNDIRIKVTKDTIYSIQDTIYFFVR